MGLSVGIVGLPNVGKSTLFNALLKKQQAFAANFPFATIEPNIGVVPVPDERLAKLARVQSAESKEQKDPPIVPATVEFLDIAGLIAGAHKGEGLGNKFLAHIRETDAICHVVRVFADENIVREGSTSPKKDFEIVQTELALADLQTLDKQKDPGNTSDKDVKRRWEIVTQLKSMIASTSMNRFIEVNEEQEKVVKELGLLTFKPILVSLNIDEADLRESSELEKSFVESVGLAEGQVVAICAKVESEIASLTVEEQAEYLSDLGVARPGLERLIKKAFGTLGLITFLTAGEKPARQSPDGSSRTAGGEVRAWTIRDGTTAQEAAGVIHTDFSKNFIKADVVKYEDFVGEGDQPAGAKASAFAGGWKKVREAGKVRSEGRDYVVQDGDVVEFKIGI